MSIENYKRLLTELGQHIGLNDLAPDEDNYCCLGFDDKIIVHFQYNIQDDVLLLFSPIGTIDEPQIPVAYPKLLQANLFWQGTAGGVLGLDPDTREVIYSYQTSIAYVDFERFQKILENYVSTAEVWINAIESINKGLDADVPKDNKSNPFASKDDEEEESHDEPSSQTHDFPPGGIKI